MPIACGTKTGSLHGPVGSVGSDQHLAGIEVADVGGDEPEPAVMVPQRRAVDAGRGPRCAGAELRAAGEDVADLRPRVRSRLWNSGAPGKYSKLECAR